MNSAIAAAPSIIGWSASSDRFLSGPCVVWFMNCSQAAVDKPALLARAFPRRQMGVFNLTPFWFSRFGLLPKMGNPTIPLHPIPFGGADGMAHYLFLVVLKSISKCCNARPSQLLRIDRSFCIRSSMNRYASGTNGSAWQYCHGANVMSCWVQMSGNEDALPDFPAAPTSALRLDGFHDIDPQTARTRQRQQCCLSA